MLSTRPDRHSCVPKSVGTGITRTQYESLHSNAALLLIVANHGQQPQSPSSQNFTGHETCSRNGAWISRARTIPCNNVSFHTRFVIMGNDRMTTQDTGADSDWAGLLAASSSRLFSLRSSLFRFWKRGSPAAKPSASLADQATPTNLSFSFSVMFA